MSIEIPAYIATGRDGKPRPWTLRPTRTATMEAATETMMGASEYHALLNRSARWGQLYKEGCRIHRATITLRKDPTT